MASESSYDYGKQVDSQKENASQINLLPFATPQQYQNTRNSNVLRACSLMNIKKVHKPKRKTKFSSFQIHKRLHESLILRGYSWGKRGIE